MSDQFQGIKLPEYKVDEEALKKAKESVFIIEDEAPEHRAKREAKEAQRATQKTAAQLKEEKAIADKERANQFYKTMQQQYDVAKQLVSKSLDNMIDKEVNKIRQELNISDEANEKIRATIRGHKNVSLNQQSLVLIAQEKTAKKINESINKQIDRFYDTRTGLVINSVNKTNEDILGFCTSMEKYAKDETPDNLAASITNQLDYALSNGKAISGVADKLNAQLGKIGLGGIDCKQFIGPMIQNFNTEGIGSSLATKLQPYIKRNIKVIQKVAKVIQKVNAAIKIFETRINLMLSKAAAAITDFAAQTLGGVVSDLASNIKISF